MLNQRFDVKHIKDDFKLIGLPDTQVYAVAVKMKRLIVTYNAKDFRPLAQTSKETGVIGVSALMSYDHIDKKLTALLTKSTANALFGKYTALRDEPQ